jgi:integrase
MESGGVPSRGGRKALALADAIEPRFRLLVLLALGCGFCMSELMGLRRMDINLHRKVRVFEQKQELKDAGIVRTDPKTDAGKRDIGAGVRGTGVGGTTFACSSGRNPRPRCSPAPRRRASSKRYKAWHKALTVVGLPSDTHPQDFWHLSNTLAAKTHGITLKDLMELMGHKSEQAAMRYLHATAVPTTRWPQLSML